ncbi:MAG: transglutaminase domain-containing protein [Oscillospiraceae bacterium]|nr:transglutaminase domain-containing protein [Oscillospiraceae bacterium]MCL2278062.1 transglutaminase domain-containing protein [Oscillospiraceae bacterium]
MSRHVKFILLVLVAALATGLLVSCDDVLPPIVADEPSGAVQPTPESDVLNVDTDNLPSTPIAPAPAIPIVLTPVASGVLVESNDFALIDFSNKEDGYIMVRWNMETDAQLRVRVVGPTGVAYNYRLNSGGEFEVFPLSDGNGEYTIMVLEQIAGTEFAVALTAVFYVQLIDEFAPFLRPNQYVNFTENCNVVAKGAQLVAGQTTLLGKVTEVYNFVITHITYDVELAQGIVDGFIVGYIPDLDDVLARGYGICFDYAAVMTAMLRSQGIPTKMIFGFVGEVYHAWINVYSEETGWINGVILFDGNEWTLMDPTFEATAGNAEALREFIGDGSSYVVMHLF